jgi:hypothetical protein
VPDGSSLDAADVAAVTEMAIAKGWTNEQAQGVLQEMATSIADQSARFLADTQAHAEIGGARLEAAQLNVNRALDFFLPSNTPEGASLRTALNRSGYGNYAPLVVLLSRIGNAMKEDRPLSQTAPGAIPRMETTDVLFPSSAKPTA